MGETEVADCDNSTELIGEDIFEEILFLELFDQIVIFVVSEGSVWN